MSQQPRRHSPDSRRDRYCSPASHDMTRRRATVAETAGQVTADCAAVCCCCSFGLIDLFYFCFIKLPTGLLMCSARKFKRRTRRCRKCPCTTSCSCSTKLRKSSLLYSVDEEFSTCFEVGDHVNVQAGSVLVSNSEPSKERMEFNREMLNYFNNSGFGRSLSRRYESAMKSAPISFAINLREVELPKCQATD